MNTGAAGFSRWYELSKGSELCRHRPPSVHWNKLWTGVIHIWINGGIAHNDPCIWRCGNRSAKKWSV